MEEEEEVEEEGVVEEEEGALARRRRQIQALRRRLWALRLLLKQTAVGTSGTRHPWVRTLRLLWLRGLLHHQLTGGGSVGFVSFSKAKLSTVAAFR